MAEFKEKRMFPRYACDTGVLIGLTEGSGGFWGTLSDISQGGCYVYTFSPLPVAQNVTLVIKANGVEIKVNGHTVSSHPGVGMGIAFSGFPQREGEQNLKTYLSHLASQPKSKEATGIFY